MTNSLKYLSWALRLIAAAILFQTLFFKFTGAEESKHIFMVLGAEPWGRLASGVVELVAVALLLIPRTKAVGALLTLGVISGAIFSHLTKLGVAVVVNGNSDNGLLFTLAIIVFVCSGLLLLLHRRELPLLGAYL